MNFQAIIFKPGQEGEMATITMSDFRSIVGGAYEITHNKHNFPNTEVIINGEGLLLELPRNRGYHGAFIVVKSLENEDVEGYASFSTEEAHEIKEVLDKKMEYVSKNQFLATFFNEKEVPVTIFQYEKGHNLITLSNYDVIESLLASEDTDLLNQAELILRKIDFANGDVNHFLEHMGHAMAEQIADSNKGFFDMLMGEGDV